jgi:hypothetical protein
MVKSLIPRGRTRTRTPAATALIGLAVSLSACGRGPAAPSLAVFGSFFPAWIVCTLAGLVIALVVRVVFVRIGLDDHLPARLLVYAALTVITAIGLWAVFYAGVAP